MPERGLRLGGRRALALSCVFAMLVAAAGDAGAAPACRKVKGRIAFESVAGGACGSAVGVCWAGSATGGLAGQWSFVASSLTPTVDTPTTSVVLLTGDSEFQTAGGDVLTKDAVVLRTTGAGDLSGLVTVTGATGDFAGATGRLMITGASASGAGEANYTGEVCVP